MSPEAQELAKLKEELAELKERLADTEHALAYALTFFVDMHGNDKDYLGNASVRGLRASVRQAFKTLRGEK